MMATSKLDTAQAARALVTKELEKRGYAVAHNPAPRHLAVESPKNKVRFYVHVKGNKKAYPWWAAEVPEEGSLFCILVVVEDHRYFVLRSAEFNQLIRGYRQEHPNQQGSGFKWSDSVPFEDRWDKLPACG